MQGGTSELSANDFDKFRDRGSIKLVDDGKDEKKKWLSLG